MGDKFRCNCPITSAVDILGDKWTIVIIKQMLLEWMKTFKDFSQDWEGIASNILSARLKKLEEYKIITKNKSSENKKTNIYKLSEKGIGLIPTILEMVLWSDQYMREFHADMNVDSRIEESKKDKKAFIEKIEEDYFISFEKN